MRPSEWKDGEIAYLRGMVARGGTPEVVGNAADPFPAMASYVDVQAVSARRAELLGLQEILLLVSDALRNSDDRLALQILDCLR